MNVPIVSLDKVYIQPDEENIFFLDCTRVENKQTMISRKGESIQTKIQQIANNLSQREIILADDVIFSGNALQTVIDDFNRLGIRVVGAICSICTKESYEKFNRNLKYGIRCTYLLGEDVIDQICERDFYFGIAGSGIMTPTKEGFAKAPYFKPYGNPCERASIDKEYERYFSIGCLERSIYLWEAMEKIKKDKIYVSALPERIVNTRPNEEVIKILKKERRRI